MSDHPRDNRDRDEEPTPQDGPKGFYRKANPYDPFGASESGEAARPESSRSRQARHRRTRRNWRSMKPRPRETAEVVESRSYWLVAVALVVGFLGGFVVRSLMLPRAPAASIPYVETPGATAMEKKPNLEEMERQTRQAIEKLSKKVQDNAVRNTPPGVEAERMVLSNGGSKPDAPPILKLKPMAAE